MGILIDPCSCSQAFYSQVFSTCGCLGSLVIRMPDLLGLITVRGESGPRQTPCGYLKPAWSSCNFGWQEVALGPSWSHIWIFRAPLGQGGSLWDPLELGCRAVCGVPAPRGCWHKPAGILMALSLLSPPHGWHQGQQYCLESSGGKLRQEHQPSRPESTLSIHSQKSQSSGHTVTKFVRSEGKEINLGRSC